MHFAVLEQKLFVALVYGHLVLTLGAVAQSCVERYVPDGNGSAFVLRNSEIAARTASVRIGDDWEPEALGDVAHDLRAHFLASMAPAQRAGIRIPLWAERAEVDTASIEAGAVVARLAALAVDADGVCAEGRRTLVSVAVVLEDGSKSRAECQGNGKQQYFSPHLLFQFWMR